MIGILNESQIRQVLHLQLCGRLACASDGKIYLVPVSYAFDDKYIYAHSREGQKINMLRKNPGVCFQVDIIDSLSSWRSVIIWGRFEELKTVKEQTRAIKLLDDRFGPLHVSESIARVSADIHPPQSVEKKKKAVYFRISLDEATGRFEKTS
ncbi:MAG TPA: pyridoxamine 5'-phosphate oxidase family protein [Cyclobacteriaceae bacterium]|nr:pyridoxamine 5'-phosphate oxidase family protein [Cyclobacteriaceae bacterium]